MPIDSPAPVPVLADAVLSKAHRDRLQQELGIEGVVSCPAKVDMRAFIPVYCIIPNQRGTSRINNNSAMIGGTANYGAFMAAMIALVPLESYGILKAWWISVELDAAGRAAIVAAADTIQLRILDNVSAVELARYRCTPGANAGGAMIEFGSHIFNHNLPTDIYPRNTTEVHWPNDYLMQRNSTMFAELTLQSAGNFPANTTANVHCFWDTYV